MELTPFYIEDGIEYESVVSESMTMRLLAAGGLRSMRLFGDIQRITAEYIKQMESQMPAGLSQKSYLSRYPDEVKADTCAMMNFIRESYPKQAKRLFCGTDEFKDFATAWCVCQFDMHADVMEDKNDSVVMFLESYLETVDKLKEIKEKNNGRIKRRRKKRSA